jgi:hypothetical protein
MKQTFGTSLLERSPGGQPGNKNAAGPHKITRVTVNPRRDTVSFERHEFDGDRKIGGSQKTRIYSPTNASYKRLHTALSKIKKPIVKKVSTGYSVYRDEDPMRGFRRLK